MSASHGSTPAAWAGTIVSMVGFSIGGVALLPEPVSTTWFWIGAGLAVAGLPVFLVLTRFGFGEQR
jgi:hypothetical protein